MTQIFNSPRQIVSLPLEIVNIMQFCLHFFLMRGLGHCAIIELTFNHLQFSGQIVYSCLKRPFCGTSLI